MCDSERQQDPETRPESTRIEDETIQQTLDAYSYTGSVDRDSTARAEQDNLMNAVSAGVRAFIVLAVAGSGLWSLVTTDAFLTVLATSTAVVIVFELFGVRAFVDDL